MMNHRQPSRWPAPLALAALLVPTAASQIQLPSEYAIGFSSVNTGVDTVRAVVAEINGTSLVDVISLNDLGEISVAFDVALGEASAVLPAATQIFHDVEVQGPSTDPLEQQLFAVGPGGLQVVNWDMPSKAFEVRDVFASGTQARTDWLGATRLRKGDLDGDGRVDLVGVAADGKTLLDARSTAAGFVPMPGTPMATPVVGSILDLTVVDGNGNGSGEIALVATTGIHWFGSTGTQLLTVPGTHTFGEIETVSIEGSNHQLVAVLQRTAPSTDRLWIVEGVQHTVVQDLDVSALDAARLVGGLYDGDRSTDLAITSRLGDEVSVLIQRPTGYSLGGTSRRQVQITNPPNQATRAPVALSDQDNDGDCDLAYVNAAKASVFMAKNDEVDHTTLAPRVLESGPDPAVRHVWVTGLDPTTTGPPTLHLRYEVPDEPNGNASGPYAGATHERPDGANALQLLLWTSTGNAVDGFVTSPTPAAALAYDIDPPVSQSQFQQTYLYANLPLGSVTAGTIFYAMARYVELDASGAVLRSWPHNTVFFTAEPETEALAHVSSFIFVSDLFEVGVADPFIAQSQNGGGTTVGDSGGVGCIPDIPEGDPPGEIPTPPSTPPSF